MATTTDTVAALVVVSLASALGAARAHADAPALPTTDATAPTTDAEAARARFLADEATRALERGERDAAVYLLRQALLSTGASPPPLPAPGPPPDEAPHEAPDEASAQASEVPPQASDEPEQASEVPEQASEMPAEPASPLGMLGLELGATAGFAWVEAGLPADRARPENVGASSPWVGCDVHGEGCTVRVRQPGFGTTLGLRGALRIRPSATWSFGLGVRVQPDSGEGALAGWLFDLEARARIAGDDVVALEALGAIGVGQIQLRPDQDDMVGPYVTSGPAWLSVGAALVVGVERGSALVIEARPRLGLPTWLFDTDLTLALRIGA